MNQELTAQIIYVAQQNVQSARNRVPLLPMVDGLHGRSFLLELALQELKELEEAIGLYGSVTAREFLSQVVAELDDVFVFLVSWVSVHAPDVDLGARPGTANGFGEKSYAFDRLAETIMDAVDDPQHALAEVIARLESIARHAPVAFVPFVDSLQKTLHQALRIHRPPELYTSHDPLTGKPLSSEEALQKYNNLEACMKMIRAAVDPENRKLRGGEWRPYKWYLLEWRNSSRTQEQLRQQLFADYPLDQSGREVVVFNSG
ncbi:MAG: hypothetical protein H6774_02680 [Pseudomonadales bacterium]|nr:hypothetical protein [Pseudomonadales bacterium]